MDKSNVPTPAFVFDFGGVLMDWNPFYLYGSYFNGDPAGVQRFLDEVGFLAWNAKNDEGRPFRQGVAELTDQFPHYAELIRAYHERWEESIGGPIWPTVEILRSLKKAGYTLYALSNWSAETFARVRHTYEFFDWFEAIVVSGEVRLLKPDPRIFQVFLERVGRRAGECLLVDDTEANTDAAARMGFQTIHYESPGQLESELIRRGLLPQDGGAGMGKQMT